MRLIRWDDYPVAAWRNGAGTTREVARGTASSPAGPDDFDWRVSLADVTASSPFSSFPGVRRVIVQVAGGPMVLTVDGQEHPLDLFRPFSFDGGAETSCRASDGATTDLNVMTRLGAWVARVEVHDAVRVRLDPPARHTSSSPSLAHSTKTRLARETPAMSHMTPDPFPVVGWVGGRCLAAGRSNRNETGYPGTLA